MLDLEGLQKKTTTPLKNTKIYNTPIHTYILCITVYYITIDLQLAS